MEAEEQPVIAPNRMINVLLQIPPDLQYYKSLCQMTDAWYLEHPHLAQHASREDHMEMIACNQTEGDVTGKERDAEPASQGQRACTRLAK